MPHPFTLVIGTKRYSSWSLRPWLLMKMAGLAFDEVEIALRQPDTRRQVLEWSPSGKVPLLIDGSLKIWDSLAICEYLAERDPGLWPADREARAMARSVSAEMHSGFMPLRQNCPMDVCAVTPMPDPLPEVAGDIARIQALWGECRARFGAAGPFLFGGFTVADAMYAPVVTRFRTYAIPQDSVCEGYCRAIEHLPAMREWVEAAG